MSKWSSLKTPQDKAVYIGKKVLGITGMILIEIFEQCEDANFLRSHPWAGYSQSIRDDREEYRLRNEYVYQLSRNQAIKRLKEGKYLKACKEGKRVIYILTNSGKARAIQTALKSSKGLLSNKTCLVSFDFPEVSRKARNYFRYYLKSVGFKFVQGSVWSIDRDVVELMNKLICLLRIKSWVKIYVVTK